MIMYVIVLNKGVDFPAWDMHNLDMDIKLGELEASVLYSIIHCGDDAYGVSICDTIKQRTGADVALGAIYATLDRLKQKKLLRSWWSDPVSERGGRRKQLFELTAAGTSALSSYDERFQRIRAGWSTVLQGGS